MGKLLPATRPGRGVWPMSNKAPLDSPLSGRHIALPESRQLDVLAALFERRQATVLRVPLVSIHDSPDQAAVIAWLQDFIAAPPDVFIVLTGEGLRRLRAAARRQGLEADFIAALARSRTVTRGPKPGRALKEMGLQADLLAVAPTTAGVIQTLEPMDLAGKHLAVQLYGEDPNEQLMSWLQTRQLARCTVVAPYVYADDSETDQVTALIEAMTAGRVDMIAFTSKPQWQRLNQVANKHGLAQALKVGMEKTLVAAIGPVVAGEIRQSGYQVDVMPAESYFMKPLVKAAEQAFAESGPTVEE